MQINYTTILKKFFVMSYYIIYFRKIYSIKKKFAVKKHKKKFFESCVINHYDEKRMLILKCKF